MGEYMFGAAQLSGEIPARTCARYDRIAKEVAGRRAGFTNVNLPGQGWTSWFSIPNHGSPFDRRDEIEILKRCGLTPPLDVVLQRLGYVSVPGIKVLKGREVVFKGTIEQAWACLRSTGQMSS
jgi:hypothetical protein